MHTAFKCSKFHRLALQLGLGLQQRQWFCAVAESCTGGGLASAITACPGSSSWFDRGFVTYSNRAKQELLSVSEQTLMTYGAVSEETACEMADGARRMAGVDISAAITGVAGPGGGTPKKPVGTVWVAWSLAQAATVAQCFVFKGNRAAVRHQAIFAALEGLLKLSRDA